MQGKKRRFRTPSPATALSVVALFVSLGGVSYAAATIGSSQIKNNSVASKDIKNKTISTKDISSKARKALKGAKGPAGAAGKVGPTGPAGRSALSSLASGERIYGTYGLEGLGPNLWTGVTFPIPAPTPVDSLHVVIANNDTVTGDGCTGTADNPVSTPGVRVPLYEHLRGHHQRIRVWRTLQLWELRRDGRREPLRLHGSSKRSRQHVLPPMGSGSTRLRSRA